MTATDIEMLTADDLAVIAASDSLTVSCATGATTSPFVADPVRAALAEVGVTVTTCAAARVPREADVVLVFYQFERWVPRRPGRVVLPYQTLIADPTVAAVVAAFRAGRGAP